MVTLENSVIRLANEKLALLEVWVGNKSDDIENVDINGLFSELSGLLEIRELDQNGLTEKAIADMNQINVRALHLMAKR